MLSNVFCVVGLCVSDGIVRKCVPVNDWKVYYPYSSVLCYESALHIMGMLLVTIPNVFLSCTSYFAVFLHEHASFHCSLL